MFQSFFNVPLKSKKKPMNKLSRLVKIMIKQLVIYWTMSIFQSIIN